MATYIIPTRTDLENYTEVVELDGVTYEIFLRWNTRDEHWYLSLQTADGTEIVSGACVTVNVPLLRSVSHVSCPPGHLMALDTSGAGEDPGIDELGGRVVLLYVEADD